MPRKAGSITMTPQPGYPVAEGEADHTSITMKYTCAESELGQIQDFGEPLLDARFAGFGGQYSYCTLSKKKIQRLKSGEAYDVELVFETDPLCAPPATVKEEYDYENNEVDVPIERHPKYRKKWNHDLHGKIGEASPGSPPSWYDGADATHYVPESDAAKYKWVKHGEKAEEGWFIPFPATKPGVESFLSGVVRVNCVKRSINKKKLQTDAQNDHKPEVPKERFGLPGDTGKWLRGASKIKQEGKHWILTVPYMFFKNGVDQAIYGNQ